MERLCILMSEGVIIIDAELEKFVTMIHAAPPMVVIEFAGAGAQALAWLHGVGGSSRTVLEATDHYAATSLIEAVGFQPKQFASPEVAQAMALRAYLRACHLGGLQAPLAGIGCTATIATDRPKRGNHRVCLAVCTAGEMTTYKLTLEKGRRSRLQEEYVVSLLLLKSVADMSGLEPVLLPELLESEVIESQVEPIVWPEKLMAGQIDSLIVWPDGRQTPGQRWPNLVILSGSFNPIHAGHKGMAQAAAKRLQQEVYFELPLINADKAPLNRAEVDQRLQQFAHFAPLILTRAPLFDQKAQIFPGSVFVLGIDTVARLLEPRFYEHSPAKMLASLEMIRQAGCRFLVAGRAGADHSFLTLAGLDIPAGYQDLFEQIPEAEFRIDVSSTEIRQTRQSQLNH